MRGTPSRGRRRSRSVLTSAPRRAACRTICTADPPVLRRGRCWRRAALMRGGPFALLLEAAGLQTVGAQPETLALLLQVTATALAAERLRGHRQSVAGLLGNVHREWCATKDVKGRAPAAKLRLCVANSYPLRCAPAPLPLDLAPTCCAAPLTRLSAPKAHRLDDDASRTAKSIAILLGCEPARHRITHERAENRCRSLAIPNLFKN